MDKIILVSYINCEGMSPSDREELFQKVAKIVPTSENGVLSFLFPTIKESYVECLNPKIVSEEEFSHAKKILENNQKMIDEFMKNN